MISILPQTYKSELVNRSKLSPSPLRQRETQVLPLRNEGVDDGGVIPQFIDNTSGSYNHAKHEEIRTVSHAVHGRGFVRLLSLKNLIL